jgi:hypothetical protein
VLIKYRATNKLNERQALFVGFVVEGASRAEARAGSSEKYADRIGDQRMRALKIVSEIARRQELQRREQDVSLAKWIGETANIAFVDPVELEDEDGKTRKLRDIPVVLRKCISNIYWTKNGQRQYELASKPKRSIFWQRLWVISRRASICRILTPN